LGISESPLVDGDRLIVTPGGRGAAIVALNKTTGETIWKSQNDEAGYSSAIAYNFGGVRQIAILTGEGRGRTQHRQRSAALALYEGLEPDRQCRHADLS